MPSSQVQMRLCGVTFLILLGLVYAEEEEEKCDNDLFCAPDFGSFGGDTVLGLCMSFVGNFVNSVGYILQKIGYRKLMVAQETDPEATILKEPIWVIGFITYAVGSLTHGAALGFASQALLVPMEGVTLVANAFLAPIFLGEKLGRNELIGSAVCCVGIVITVLFGPNGEQDFTTDDLLEFYISVQFIVYGCLQGGGGVVAWVLLQGVQVLNKEDGIEYDGTDGTMQQPRARRSALLHVAIAGVLAAFNVLFLKTVSTVFLNSPEPAAERFASPWPYMFLVLFVLCNVAMEIWKQRALQQFESVYIVPVFQAALIVLAVLTGGVYFKEFNEMKPFNLVIFGVGLGTVAAGVFFLALEQESKLGKMIRDKVLPMLRIARAFGGNEFSAASFAAAVDAGKGDATIYPVQESQEPAGSYHRPPRTVEMALSLGLAMGGSKNPSRNNSRAGSQAGSRRPSQAGSPAPEMHHPKHIDVAQSSPASEEPKEDADHKLTLTPRENIGIGPQSAVRLAPLPDTPDVKQFAPPPETPDAKQEDME